MPKWTAFSAALTTEFLHNCLRVEQPVEQPKIETKDLEIVPRPLNTKLSELYKDKSFRDCLKRGWLAERIANLHLLTKHQAADVLQELAQGLRDGSVTLECQNYQAEPFWRGVWRVMWNCLAWSAIALALTLLCWGCWHAFTRH